MKVLARGLACLSLVGLLMVTTGCPEETHDPLRDTTTDVPRDPAPTHDPMMPPATPDPDPARPTDPDTTHPDVTTPGIGDRTMREDPATEMAPPNPQEVMRQVEAGEALLLDVRTEDERADRQLRDAAWMPMEQLDRMRDEPTQQEIEGLRRDQMIYTFSETAQRAQRAAEILREQGYQARHMEQSYDELVQVGFVPHDAAQQPQQQQPQQTGPGATIE